MRNKNDVSENEKFFDKDASLLFNKELEQLRDERQKSIELNVTSPEARARRESEQRFYDSVLSAFEEVEAETYKNGETCYDIAQALKNLLLKSDLELYSGARIFGTIRLLIGLDEKRFINAAPIARQDIVIGHLYTSLHIYGKDFCIQRLKGQIDENALPKSLVHLIDFKKRIIEDKHSIDPETKQLRFTDSLMAQAVTELINAIERVIDLEENEITINKRLELNKQLENSEAEKKAKEKRIFGGSQYQNLLAIHYLFEYLQAKDNKKAQARFASFLTGFSEANFYNKSLNIHAEQDKDGVKWEKDMEKVKGFFADLGLDGIVRMVNNDLNS